MKISVIIIFDKFRKSKLIRLLNTIKPQLKHYNAEILLIHESKTKLKLPSLPVKVRYINIPPKKGIPFNRNKGIKHANGDIIVFIDDDCWVSKNWLNSLIEPLKKDEGLMAVTSCTKIPKSNLIGDSIAALGFPGGGSLGFENVWEVKKGFTNHLTVGNCALRKTLFKKIGMFDESMKSGAEDAELSVRIEKAKIPIKYVPEAYAYHEARDTLSSFIKWQLRRGRANYQLKKKIGKVNKFVKLRFWSAKNLIKKNIFNWRLPIILFFLLLSFVLQQLSYINEAIKNR